MQKRTQVLASKTAGNIRNVFRRAFSYYLAAFVASAGTKIDEPVGAFDQVKVVLDEDDAVSSIHKPLKNLQ